jgi:ketosteroid isomerase-like protein
MPANNVTVRCTDVFQKDASGNWPIVNEHCSPVPKAT